MATRTLILTLGLTLIGLGFQGAPASASWTQPAPSKYYRATSPLCYSNAGTAQSDALPIDNGAVVQYEESSPEQYKARAHVEGAIVKLFNDATGHNHFEIQVGPNNVLEVIYNQDFGALPDLRLGMTVEACGDYITSRKQDGPYPPSPAGAIIHWVHLNPSNHGHPSGFLIIDGTLYGNQPTRGNGGNSND